MGLEHLLQDANQTREVCTVVGPALATRSLKDFLELCLATEISPVNEQPEQTTSVIGSHKEGQELGHTSESQVTNRFECFQTLGLLFVSFFHFCVHFPLPET